jgi:hypothetical protein
MAGHTFFHEADDVPMHIAVHLADRFLLGLRYFGFFPRKWGTRMIGWPVLFADLNG